MDSLLGLAVVLLALEVGGEQNPPHYGVLLTQAQTGLLQLQDNYEDFWNEFREIPFTDVAHVLQKTKILYQYAETENIVNTLGTDSNQTVNTLCANQSGEALAALLEGRQWALQMIDAAGKPGSGLLQAQLTFLGSYEECIGVKAVPSNSSTPSQIFNGKYCRATVPLGPQTSQVNPAFGGLQFGVTFGLCFPDSCQSEDVKIILNDLLDTLREQLSLNINFTVGSTDCVDENRSLDARAIVVLVVSILFLVVLLLGTVYDLVFLQLPKWYGDVTYRAEDVTNGDVAGANNTSTNISVKVDERSHLLADKPKLDRSPSEPSLCGKILLSFSIYTNGLKLLSTKQNAGSLTAVNGVRFLSLTWVILGHTYIFGLSSVDNLLTYFPELLKRFSFQAISNATVSVDSFFTLSGLLVAYLTLREMKKTRGKINWIMFYFHRFWRLTPPYMLLLMVYVSLFPYISNGPLWSVNAKTEAGCPESWWTNLLYINNLVKVDKMCMGWSWYLANDMQFYILSPLIIVPFFFSGIIGTITALVFLLATMTTAGVISRVNNMAAGLAAPPAQNSTDAPDQMTYFMDYYITPYCRMGPYIMGIVTGYLLYVTDCKIRLNKWLVTLGWCVATASALAVVYGLYDTTQGHPVTVDVAAFYNAVHRTVWGACLCWVIFACATGYGGFVNTLLSWKVFVPLGRLTYCAYLVHPIVMYAYFNGQHTLQHLTDVNIVFLFLAFLLSSYGLAFLVSLAFESPMMGLEKALLKREKSS